MKDWEITGSYYLPRILYLRSRNNTLPGKLPKPNMRYLSLSEDAHWTLWRSSDYFYPEMIPEPDYSDSSDEAAYEDENRRRQRFPPDSRPALERLRDLTEVYVTSASTKKKPTGRQVEFAPKTALKQTPKTSAKDSPQARKTPKLPPKSPAKKQTKSTTEVWKTETPSAAAKRSARSPERGAKDAPRTKTSGEKATEIKKTVPAETKAAAKSKSPPAGTTAKTAGKMASSKPVAKKEAVDKKKAVPSEEAKTKASGDSADIGDKAASGKSTSAEQSSDEDQLIKPKKPYVPSTEKQKLHKELKFSQKYGKLAPSKTELQLALERYTENKVKRELDAEEKSSLEKILEYQAKKIEMQEAVDTYPDWAERLQKPPCTWSNPRTEEFYRVHARVVSNNILTHCFLDSDESDSQQGCCSSLPPRMSTLHSDSDS